MFGFHSVYGKWRIFCTNAASIFVTKLCDLGGTVLGRCWLKKLGSIGQGATQTGVGI